MTAPSFDTSAADRVDAILAGCFERPAEEWDAAFDAACAAHPDLTGDLRRRAAWLRAVGMLETIAATRTRVGHYRLLEPLGSGGMGVVYAATDERTGGEVALKVVRDHQLFPATRARFEREIATIRRLSHPNIVRLLDAGSSDGVPFIAMERLRGVSLAELLALSAPARVETLGAEDAQRVLRQRGTPSPAALARLVGSWPQVSLAILAEVADGLAYAHRHGVVHRDVKPSNIVLTFDGRVILLDFGLASRVGEERLTRSGVQLGSLPYMAPEQVRGGAVDARTDVYGLGVTLYEMLTRATPYWSDRTEALLAAILDGNPVRVRQRNRAVGRDADLVCHKAFDPLPAQRYASAEAFAADLRAAAAGRRVDAKRTGFVRRLHRACRRRPYFAATSTVLLSLAIAVPVAINVATAGQRDRALLQSYAALSAAASEDLRGGSVLAARDKLARCPEHLRGFEWNLMMRRQDGSVARFVGHRGHVMGVKWYGDRVFTAAFDGTLRAWRASDGHALWSTAVPGGLRTGFDLDPTRACLALLEGAVGVSTFDTDTGTQRSAIALPEPGVALSHDGEDGLWVASAHELFQLDVDAASVRASWPIANRIVFIAAIGGQRVVVVTSEAGASLCDVGQGTTMTLSDSAGAESVAAGGDRIAVGQDDGRIHLYDRDGKPLRTLAGHQRRGVSALEFAPDGRTLFSGGRDCTVHVWDLTTGRLRTILIGHEASLTGLAVDGSGQHLASVTAYHPGRIWDLARSGARVHLAGTGSPINVLLWSRRDGRLYGAAYDGSVSAWAADGQLLWRAPLGRVLAESPAGNLLVAASSAQIAVAERATGAVRYQARAPTAPWMVACSADGSLLALGGEAPAVFVYDARSLAAPRRIDLERWVRAVAFDPEGRLWVDQDDCLLAFDLARGECVRRVQVTGDVHKLVFLRHEHRLYCAEQFRLTTLDLASAAQTSWSGHRSWVRGLDVSPDRTRVATGSTDGSVRIWLAGTGDCVATLDHFDDYVYQVAFSPDGKRLAAGGDTGDITIWDGR